ncbi:hypothetical protein Bcav_1044 [Beutenbergia cavernae DSM 12333]|uniref:Uncharacterized protein n=1 Tax=Beutenbergia cavernae (strain ATCC BAA-8 / DSM 12333 / CCUG 43141 / JCM 11478 / NBRC 16432 / NCIMB 13614 / HKI 0122) TaxID=471853 RepID=C5C0B9_BEUC1|nr:hypothetical protein [Beutenbergia cavernae]ACQ79305.1 hypothetical protein Bcav_1044 [Beutenbergia cavernae DSM 12333]
MARIVYGDKISEDPQGVRYRVSSPDHPNVSVLAIGPDGRSASSEGSGPDLNIDEQAIHGKARRLWVDSGSWPEHVSFYA